jgi:hypothetical protein
MSTSPSLLDADLAAALGPDLAAEWLLPRGPQPVAVHVARSEGRVVAAALVSRRPATLAAKIAHTWTESGEADAALRDLVDGVLADSRDRGDVCVKWQTGLDDQTPERSGFTAMRAPHASAPGTEGVAGWVFWLRPPAHEEPPYYSQTSTFTCGAVTALLASEIRGSGGFASGGGNRDRELDFWRTASNYPTCEPIGLAVALREFLADAAGSSPVEVFLDADGPVLLESYTSAFDRGFRAELQENSLRKALGSDIAVRRDRLPIEEVASRVGAGELALLLIDLEPMYGFAVPHWVLAHAASDGVVYLDDPWISVNWGETWVDAHELPVAVADLDRMVAWGEDGYRGVVFVRR